jgi:uncharacterized membrane protein
MPSGSIELSYVLGVVGTKEHASALISEARAILNEMEDRGINISEADESLLLAQNAYDEGQYMQSEQHATQAKNQAIETDALALEAGLAVEDAQSAIDAAENAGRTSLLEQAREELQNSGALYNIGNYQESKQLAEQAKMTALESVKPPFDITYLIIGTIGLGMLSSIFFISKKSEGKQKNESFKVDLEKVFSQHNNLRFDEKEVLKFIAEANEGVFVSELRQHFDVARSTLWRMIRRLENDGIVKTNPVGRETFVQIHPKFS